MEKKTLTTILIATVSLPLAVLYHISEGDPLENVTGWDIFYGFLFSMVIFAIVIAVLVFLV